MFLGTAINRIFNCKIVGSDEFGNQYYVAKKSDNEGVFRRSVKYNGLVEPSKIPAMWNAWLHYIIDKIPNNKTYNWEKPHLPNLTGTTYCYKPENLNLLEKIGKNYQSWEPKGGAE